MKELRALGYSPERTLQRATQEDAAAYGDASATTGQPQDSGDSKVVGEWSEKRRELVYEMNRLTEGRAAGAVSGIPGVFRNDGLTLEQMVEKLRQDPAYQHIRDVDDLVDLLHTAIFGTTNMAAQGIPPSESQLREQLGIDTSTTWWKDSWREPPVARSAPQIDPKVLAGVIGTFRQLASRGVTDFTEAVTFLTDTEGAALVEGLGPALSRVWNHLRRENPKMSPAPDG